MLLLHCWVFSRVLGSCPCCLCHCCSGQPEIEPEAEAELGFVGANLRLQVEQEGRLQDSGSAQVKSGHHRGHLFAQYSAQVHWQIL